MSSSSKRHRIGLVGLDTSHVTAFARVLNHPEDPEHVSGAEVVAGFPGGSKDFQLSIGRVEGFTKELREKHSVRICDTPEAVAEACDLLFISAVDGRTHLDYVKRTIGFKRPTFIDKPMTTSLADAREIFRLAEGAGVPVMSCSSLRYAEPLQQGLAAAAETIGPILGCDVYGPMAIEPTQPGLFWYGIHQVEILSAVLGTGAKSVKATTNEDCDLIAGTWGDGRIASIRGMRKGHHKFGLTLHGEKASQHIDLSAGKKSYYAGMLEAILRALPNGRSDIAPEATLEIIRFIEAANESRQTGQAVGV